MLQQYNYADTGREQREAMSNALSNSVRGQLGQILSGSNYTGDTLHQIDVDFGYPDELDFQKLWNMYRRFGIAKNVVQSLPDICWIDAPTVEGSAQFNNELQLIIDNLNLWQRMKGADTRQRVGRYAGIFMRVRDGLSPELPLKSKLPGVGALVQMIPLYESQLVVNETIDDITDDNYGMPKMYQFNSSAVGSRTTGKNSFNIHPSRVVIFAEGSDNGDIYGISSLEAPYNSLMDLRKIIGAGGEGFYKNAAKDVVFELKDASTAKQNSALLEKFNDNYDDWARNRARRALWTPGLEAKILESRLDPPKDFFMNALYDVSASSQTPASVLIGNQTGKLAGDQDGEQYLTMAQSRRENFLTESIGSILDWLINNGILPSSNYEIQWSDLRENSDADKLDLSKKMAETVALQFRAGQAPSYSSEEIREQGGYEAEVFDIEPSEEINEDE